MERTLIKGNLSNSVQDFPIVMRKRQIIYYKFVDNLGYDDKVTFVLYEYIPQNNKGVMRWKKYGKWQKNWTLAFCPTNDYYLKKNIKYRLEVIYKNNTNVELKDIAYFEL